MKRFGIALGMIVATAAPAQAEQLVGLTSDNRIVAFDSATPGTLQSSRAILGLGSDSLLGIDLRASDRNIYGLGQSGAVYRLGLGAGGYTAVNLGTITTALNGTNFDIDFNPVPNRIRVASNANQSLRLNPDVGGGTVGTTVDGSFTYGSGDAPAVVGVAYTNNRSPATTTTLYALDASRNQLTIVDPPNAGVLSTPVALSGLTLSPGALTGFDISGASGTAYVAFDNNLYTLNLGTGSASLVGGFGRTVVTDVTAFAVPEPASWAMMIAGFGLAGVALRRSAKVSNPGRVFA